MIRCACRTQSTVPLFARLAWFHTDQFVYCTESRTAGERACPLAGHFAPQEHENSKQRFGS
jgi:hypothetical protein